MSEVANRPPVGGRSDTNIGIKTESLLTKTFTAYYYITWGIWLRRCLEGREHEYVLHWPRLLTSVPEVRHVADLQVPDVKSGEDAGMKTKVQ